MRRLYPLFVLLLASACLSTSSRRPRAPRRSATKTETPSKGSQSSSSWMMSQLPKSGDPKRPNIMVSVEVRRLTKGETLSLRARLAGRVQGPFFAVEAGAAFGAQRRISKSRRSQFIVVQSGRRGVISVQQPWEGSSLEVTPVFLNGGLELELATQMDGSFVETTIIVAPGSLVVLGAMRGLVGQETLGPAAYDRVRSESSEVILLKASVIG